MQTETVISSPISRKMTTYLYVAVLGLIGSCGQISSKSDKNAVANAESVFNTKEILSIKPSTIKDKTVKFLWRDNKYDEALHDTFNSIIINEDFCKTITDPERAVLGYVATFIGNECWWDGQGNDDRSNLKCKILTALNLGYQCSDKHLGFLRQWFKDDKKSLEELKNCPTIPYTSTIQETFDEITMTVKGNNISVSFKVSGVNTREGESWNWTETDHFQFDDDKIKLIKKDKSKVKHEHFEMGE